MSALWPAQKFVCFYYKPKKTCMPCLIKDNIGPGCKTRSPTKVR